jgi:hypothetical protein
MEASDTPIIPGQRAPFHLNAGKIGDFRRWIQAQNIACRDRPQRAGYAIAATINTGRQQLPQEPSLVPDTEGLPALALMVTSRLPLLRCRDLDSSQTHDHPAILPAAGRGAPHRALRTCLTSAPNNQFGSPKQPITTRRACEQIGGYARPGHHEGQSRSVIASAGPSGSPCRIFAVRGREP